jgi:hypothetical protein
MNDRGLSRSLGHAGANVVVPTELVRALGDGLDPEEVG